MIVISTYHVEMWLKTGWKGRSGGFLGDYSWRKAPDIVVSAAYSLTFQSDASVGGTEDEVDNRLRLHSGSQFYITVYICNEIIAATLNTLSEIAHPSLFMAVRFPL